MSISSYIIAFDGGIFAKYDIGKVKAMTDEERKRLNMIYGAQLALNFIWSPVYFGHKKLGLASGIILAILGTIVYLQSEYRKYNALAANLFVPYCMWVSYASYLSIYTWLNNKTSTND